jgi:hypothetical protein
MTFYGTDLSSIGIEKQKKTYLKFNTQRCGCKDPNNLFITQFMNMYIIISDTLHPWCLFSLAIFSHDYDFLNILIFNIKQWSLSTLHLKIKYGLFPLLLPTHKNRSYPKNFIALQFFFNMEWESNFIFVTCFWIVGIQTCIMLNKTLKIWF